MLLRKIKLGIGSLQQGGPIVRRQRLHSSNGDGCSCKTRPCCNNGFSDEEAHALENLRRLFNSRPRKQQQQFIPAPTAQYVDASQAVNQSLADVLQQTIPSLMAILVIHFLEVVEVQNGGRERNTTGCRIL